MDFYLLQFLVYIWFVGYLLDYVYFVDFSLVYVCFMDFFFMYVCSEGLFLVFILESLYLICMQFHEFLDPLWDLVACFRWFLWLKLHAD